MGNEPVYNYVEYYSNKGLTLPNLKTRKGKRSAEEYIKYLLDQGIFNGWDSNLQSLDIVSGIEKRLEAGPSQKTILKVYDLYLKGLLGNLDEALTLALQNYLQAPGVKESLRNYVLNENFKLTNDITLPEAHIKQTTLTNIPELTLRLPVEYKEILKEVKPKKVKPRIKNSEGVQGPSIVFYDNGDNRSLEVYFDKTKPKNDKDFASKIIRLNNARKYIIDSKLSLLDLGLRAKVTSQRLHALSGDTTWGQDISDLDYHDLQDNSITIEKMRADAMRLHKQAIAEMVKRRNNGTATREDLEVLKRWGI